MTKQVREAVGSASSAEADELLLLALLNTTPTVAGRRQDDLAEDASARSWLAANAGEAAGGQDVARLREVRTALQRVVLGETSATTLAGALSGVRLVPELTDGGVTWVRESPSATSVAARAVLTWDRLRTDMPGRLRHCENPECTLFFVDRSRNNGGRWCSMATCGNRMKARRHHERSRTQR